MGLKFGELSISTPDGELSMKKEVNDTTSDRPSKNMANAKNDIADLTDQITDAINALASAAKRQAQSGYTAAQGATATVEETLEDVSARRPLVTVGLAFGIGFLIGVNWRR